MMTLAEVDCKGVGWHYISIPRKDCREPSQFATPKPRKSQKNVRTAEVGLGVFREYAELGIQPIITLIDSDLPLRVEDDEAVFSDDDIIITLHDEGYEGRLFRMPSW